MKPGWFQAPGVTVPVLAESGSGSGGRPVSPDAAVRGLGGGGKEGVGGGGGGGVGCCGRGGLSHDGRRDLRSNRHWLAAEGGLQLGEAFGMLFEGKEPDGRQDGTHKQEEEEKPQEPAAAGSGRAGGRRSFLPADEGFVGSRKRDGFLGCRGEIDGVGARGGPVARVEQDGAFIFAGIGRQGGFRLLDLVDVLEDFGPAMRALGGILGGHLGEEPAVGNRQARQDVAGIGQVIGLLGFEQGVKGTPLEGRGAGEQMIEGEAEGIDVGSAIRLAPLDLFRGDVGGGAFDAGRRFAGGGGTGDARQAQIGQFDRAVGAQQDVAGLDVAVDQARLAPDRVEGAGDDLGQFQGLAMGHALVLGEPFGEVGAGHVFHYIIEGAVVLSEIQDANHGGVGEFGGGAGFLLELFARLRVCKHVGGQDFNGDDAVEG